MTEIVAAHLERVAQLAAIIEEHIPMESCAGEPGDAGCSCAEKFSGEYTWKGYCDHLAGKLAAALAACAREAKLEVLHRLPAHAWPDKTTYPQKWGVELRNALQDELLKAMDEVALERAVGEKAPLDPQGGQHDS